MSTNPLTDEKTELQSGSVAQIQVDMQTQNCTIMPNKFLTCTLNILNCELLNQ